MYSTFFYKAPIKTNFIYKLKQLKPDILEKIASVGQKSRQVQKTTSK